LHNGLSSNWQQAADMNIDTSTIEGDYSEVGDYFTRVSAWSEYTVSGSLSRMTLLATSTVQDFSVTAAPPVRPTTR
jgi:hypothetical protein